MSVLVSMQSATTGFEDWPMFLGQITFAIALVSIRVRLHHMPDQQRACTMFSWIFACLHCVFIDGPVVAASLLPLDLPTLPAAHWVAIAGVMAMYAFYTVIVNIELVPRMLIRASMVASIAITPVTFTELGQPHTTIYACAGLLMGEVMGLLVDLRAHSRELELAHSHSRELAEVERKAFRVVNHTSKRVMSNTAQCCELVARTLQPHTAALGDDASRVLRMLESMRAQSVNGFHMCSGGLELTQPQSTRVPAAHPREFGSHRCRPSASPSTRT